MINNTAMGKYPVPNPIPSSYLTKNVNPPKLMLLGDGVLRRLESFGMQLEDVIDPDKMFGILTPREFNTFYTMCDFAAVGYSQLMNIFGNDFLPFNKYSLISEKEQKPTETSAKYLDQLRFSDSNIDPVVGLSFILGYSIDKVPEQLDVELKYVQDGLLLGIVRTAEPQGTERYIYNVCNTACNKLYEIYGFRWVAKTRVFSELVRLSQLSALNRNS